MASFSLNSVATFSSTLQAKLRHTPRCYSGDSTLKTISIATASSGPLFGLRENKKDKRLHLFHLAADSNQLATNSTGKESGDTEKALTDDQVLAAKPTTVKSPIDDISNDSSAKVGPKSQRLEASNGTGVPSDRDRNRTSSPRRLKRSPLTAREKLKAARVLSRYTDSKPSKSEFGSKVLDALRESERGKKKSRLPEAPTNLLDDSKRGMPKQGLTFDFPGGFDLFVIVLSFVLITTTMFATTYIVWKLGAIHFNEN